MANKCKYYPHPEYDLGPVCDAGADVSGSFCCTEEFAKTCEAAKEEHIRELEQENAALTAKLEDCYRNPKNYIHEPICSKQLGPRSECSVCSRSPHFHDRLAKQYDEARRYFEEAK